MDPHVDNLFNTVKELQKEKNLLHEKLNHLQVKCSDVEKQFDTVLAKNALLKDTQRKMEETLEVAHLKVQQNQIQTESDNQANEKIRESISIKEQEIKQKKIEQTDEREKFEQTLMTLSDEFRQANIFYKDDTLKDELKSMNTMKSDIENEIKQAEHREKQLQSKLNDLHKRKNQLSQRADSLSEKERLQVWKVMTDAVDVSKNKLEKSKKELENIYKEEENLMARKKDIVSKLFSDSDSLKKC